MSPLGLNAEVPSPMPLRDVAARLKADGLVLTVISADEASAATFGTNPLDPATRAPAAAAGYAQGRRGL